MALLGTGCTRCGQPYAAHGIRVLAQRQEIAFVQLVCFACQTQTLALVTGAPATDDDADGLGEGTLGDALAGDRDDDPKASHRARQPISEVDVLEMRAYLAEYQGDVRGLFGAPPDESEPGGGAAHDETDKPG
jgi:hypothetical protein